METKTDLYKDAWQYFNNGLAEILKSSNGDPEEFAFQLTAPISAMVEQGFIDKKVGMQVVMNLHKLHNIEI